MLLVPKAGLEPARISTVDFESTASTDFATSALKRYAENVVDYTCNSLTRNSYPLPHNSDAEKNSIRFCASLLNQRHKHLGHRNGSRVRHAVQVLAVHV
jgi:hypothetical protein